MVRQPPVIDVSGGWGGCRLAQRGSVPHEYYEVVSPGRSSTPGGPIGPYGGSMESPHQEGNGGCGSLCGSSMACNGGLLKIDPRVFFFEKIDARVPIPASYLNLPR